MIEERKITAYWPVCDECGWTGGREMRKGLAEASLSFHRCGFHAEEYNSTGGYRGILGGYNRYCVCGARYVSNAGEPFSCPKEGT